MNTRHQSHKLLAHKVLARKILARKASVRRRYGASMPVAPSDRSRARSARPGGPGRAGAWPQSDSYRARLAAMPDGFLNWLDEAPVWPEDARECVGPAAG